MPMSACGSQPDASEYFSMTVLTLFECGPLPEEGHVLGGGDGEVEDLAFEGEGAVEDDDLVAAGAGDELGLGRGFGRGLFAEGDLHERGGGFGLAADEL